MTRIVVLPSAVVTVSLASNPAGPGEVLSTSTRIVLSAPGLSCAVTSAECGWSQPPVPGWPSMTRWPLIVNLKKSSAVAISSAFSTLESARGSDATNKRWPRGLFGPLSPACQIHPAPSNGASGSSSFRELSEPIHSALPQSDGSSSPIVQSAGWLQDDGLPSLSHTRTFQKHGWCERSGLPA